MKDEKKYQVQDSKLGIVIGYCLTMAEAKDLVKHFEDIDKAEGIYTTDSYEIVEMEEDQKKYQVQSAKSKVVIADNLTIIEAKSLQKQMDEIDRDDPTFASDFYDIVEMEDEEGKMQG
jgi:ribosomal protein S17